MGRGWVAGGSRVPEMGRIGIIYYVLATLACNFAIIYYILATRACQSVVNISEIACRGSQNIINNSKIACQGSQNIVNNTNSIHFGARDPPATHPADDKQTNNNLNRAGPRSNAPEQLIRCGAPLTPM